MENKKSETVLIGFGSFIYILKSLSNDNHEASQKAEFLLDRFDML